MKIRVFIPGPEDDGNYNGADYDFEVMPQVGQVVRFTRPLHTDFEVRRAGFIQDGDDFVASLWLKNDPAAETDKWIEGMIG